MVIRSYLFVNLDWADPLEMTIAVNDIVEPGDRIVSMHADKDGVVLLVEHAEVAGQPGPWWE